MTSSLNLDRRMLTPAPENIRSQLVAEKKRGGGAGGLKLPLI